MSYGVKNVVHEELKAITEQNLVTQHKSNVSDSYLPYYANKLSHNALLNQMTQ
jgi:hypothetical protein